MGPLGCWQLTHSGRWIVATVIFTLLLTSTSTTPAAADVNRWTRGGFGDVVRAIAIDPETPSTVYVGAAGTVYKSVNWGRIFRLSLSDVGAVSSLAIDPLEPSILYAGTSEGVWKSVDAGMTWDRASNGLPPVAVQTLIIDPQTPLTLYAGFVERGVWKSVDGGTSWRRSGESLREVSVTALTIDPQHPATLFAGTSAGRVWKSTEGGENWSVVLHDVDSVRALAIDPEAPTTVFAGTPDGVWRTIDGGTSWSQPGNERLPVLSLTFREGTSTLWVVTEGRGLWKTDDDGETWIFFWDQPGLTVFAVDPYDSFNLYAGTHDQWFWRSDDRGARWTQSFGDGFPNARFHDFYVDPTEPDELYASSYDVGTLISRDGGTTWTFYAVDASHSVAIDPSEPRTVYYASISSVYKSRVDSTSIDEILDTAWPITAFLLEPGTPATLYVGTQRGGVLRSRDGGDTWERVINLFARVEVLTFDPQTPTTLYLGSRQGGLWKSTDGGDTWNVISSFVASGFLAIDPVTPTTLYSRSDSFRGVSKSTDGGVTWSDVSRGLEDLWIRSLAIDPERPTTLWVGTSDGVYRSVDGARSWFRFGGGLDDIDVLQVELDPVRPEVLYAGTESGIFMMEEVTQLGLQNDRFEVEVFWQDFEGLRGTGAVALLPERGDVEPVPLRSRDSAVLEFFSPDNWELLIKVLDGRSMNERFWVFYAAATDVEVTLTVTDTSCGDVQIYQNALGEPAPAVTDTDAFEGCESPLPPSCVADEDTLCLGEDGRFEVELDWRDFDGHPGVAREVRVPPGALATNDDSGLFYFFSEDNWELLVKVLDGCTFNGSYWVFAAATTDVGYTLRVTDRMTGEVQEYSNPLGIASPAITDTTAFPTCYLE